MKSPGIYAILDSKGYREEISMQKKTMRLRGITSGEKKAQAGDKRLTRMMKALKAIHSVSPAESMEPEDLAKQRAAQEILGRLAAPMIGDRKSVV